MRPMPCSPFEEDGRISAQRSLGESRRTFGPGRVFLVVMTAWAVGMILPSLYNVVEPLASFGLSADNDGVILDVVAPFDDARESPAALAGVVPGDRVDLRVMQCFVPTSPPCASLVVVLGGLGGLQNSRPGREIDLTILPARGGAAHTVHLRAALAPLGWPARVVLLATTVVGVLFVAIAFWLVWTRPSRMTWGFFLYAAWFNPGQTYAYYAVLQAWPVAVLIQEFAEALAQGAANAGLLAFALRFPTEEVGRRWIWAERALPWLGAVFALLMLLSAGNLFGFPTERIADTAFLGNYAVAAAVILVLLVRRRHLHPQDEQRMRWAIAGCAIGLPAFIFAEICQSSGLLHDLWGATLSQTTIWLIYLLHGVLAYFVGTAVRRRRVVSVAIPLRHGTIITALMLILGVPIVYLHDAVAAYQESLHLPEWVWPLLVAPIVLLIFNRLHDASVELVDHVFNRGFHKARDSLGRAGGEMRNASSLTEVDRLLVEEPARRLKLSSAAVFRYVDGTLRRVDPAIGWDHAALRELKPDLDELVLQTLKRDAPLRLRRGQWQRLGLPPDDRAPCLVVPVCGGAREGTAVALFGPHEVGSDLNADEREMLHELAEHAATAYDRVETDFLRREVRELRAKLAALGDRAAAGESRL
jgi:hypothetical protein